MCYGSLDPKFLQREMEARLDRCAFDRPAEVADGWRVGAALARVPGRIAGVWRAAVLPSGWGRGIVQKGAKP